MHLVEEVRRCAEVGQRVRVQAGAADGARHLRQQVAPRDEEDRRLHAEDVAALVDGVVRENEGRRHSHTPSGTIAPHLSMNSMGRFHNNISSTIRRVCQGWQTAFESRQRWRHVGIAQRPLRPRPLELQRRIGSRAQTKCCGRSRRDCS